MFNVRDTRPRDYALRCKGCEETIPAPVETLPDTWIIADNPLCGSKYRYLPTGTFRGRLSHWLSILFKTGPACD
jgi:hypothetical protein